MTDTVNREETRALISSNKVEDTNVYASDGDKIGHIAHLMIGKRSGKVEYAVMSSGGFLGMGSEYRPVPWGALSFDESKDGYVLGMDKNRLPDAPSYERHENPNWDPDYGARVNTYYGLGA
ncbi:PRC-barrel domain-containing protein [Erythrobacter sp. HL-111]|uniref:PRC-barrel domain-containing protein n=1 Tax=Erythrobacter sp. HL-111 TaxID=1798193 RepID=UPI0006DA0EAB|nr:PRC-barrel domain-containing protein [Erythrobacter sp. HL-111]KPP92198.1 MAG: PRC-barrel domain [Erythrobacteraceae bacterium HL-111]SDS39305.1 PRC-barrel domain-containing protein [Erythrobacter sp. HL-111]